MNKKLEYIKSFCKTTSQRNAFNKLIKSFSTGDITKDRNIVKVNLPMTLTEKILKEGERLIKTNDLVFYTEDVIRGRECNPHITLFTDIPEGEVQNLLYNEIQNKLTIRAKITGISTFDNPDYLVVKYDIESPYLIALHDSLVIKYNLVGEVREYRPHITIAYVKPDSNINYNTDLVGYEFDISSVDCVITKVVNPY